MMTSRERTKLRTLQDRWLRANARTIATHPDTTPITEGGPTIRQVREFVLPAWVNHFEATMVDTEL